MERGGYDGMLCGRRGGAQDMVGHKGAVGGERLRRLRAWEKDVKKWEKRWKKGMDRGDKS